MATTSRERAAQVLDALANYRRVSDGELARRVGKSRGTVQAKRTGATALNLKDLDTYAEALRVDVGVFFMEPDEALRWVLDNDSGRRNPVTDGKSLPATAAA